VGQFKIFVSFSIKGKCQSGGEVGPLNIPCDLQDQDDNCPVWRVASGGFRTLRIHPSTQFFGQHAPWEDIATQERKTIRGCLTQDVNCPVWRVAFGGFETL